MTPGQTTIADKTKSVTASWDKTPSGPKKDAALKHYPTGEKARRENNDVETNK